MWEDEEQLDFLVDGMIRERNRNNHQDLDPEQLDEIRRENMMDYMNANGNLDAYYEDQAAGFIP